MYGNVQGIKNLMSHYDSDGDYVSSQNGYGAEIQYQGVTVLSNLGNGWGYEMTPAELAKKDEFYSIYWSEYNFVKENGSSELREMPDYLDQDRPSFEARA